MGYTVFFYRDIKDRNGMEKLGQDYGYWTGRTLVSDGVKYPYGKEDWQDPEVKLFTSSKRALASVKAALKKYPDTPRFVIEADNESRTIAACNLPTYLREGRMATSSAAEEVTEKEKLYPFMTDKEESFLKITYSRRRRSAASVRKLAALLGTFSNWAQKPLFEMDGRDGQRYIEFLVGQVREGSMTEETCRSIYFELRSFYEYTSENGLCGQPFSSIGSPFESPSLIKVEDLVTLSDVDQLLSDCDEDPQLYLSVLFAFRMSLNTSDFVSIRKSDLVIQKGSGEMLLRVKRFIEESGQKEDRYLLIPDDVRPAVDVVLKSTNPLYPYLFCSRLNKPFTERAIQKRLKEAQKGREEAITFRDLRALSLFLMVFEGIPKESIAAYAGIKGQWLYSYDHIPKELIFDAASLLHIRVLS